jgi:hypothetical protein
VGPSAVIVVVATALLFAMIYVIPGDPARVALGPRVSEAVRVAFRTRMGIDRPAWQQFLTFGMNVFRGALGEEVISNPPVLTVLMDQFPYSSAHHGQNGGDVSRPFRRTGRDSVNLSSTVPSLYRGTSDRHSGQACEHRDTDEAARQCAKPS